MANKQGNHWLQKECRRTGRMMEVRIMPEDYVPDAKDNEILALGVRAYKARQAAINGLAQLAELEVELARLKKGVKTK